MNLADSAKEIAERIGDTRERMLDIRNGISKRELRLSSVNDILSRLEKERRDVLPVEAEKSVREVIAILDEIRMDALSDEETAKASMKRIGEIADQVGESLTGESREEVSRILSRCSGMDVVLAARIGGVKRDTFMEKQAEALDVVGTALSGTVVKDRWVARNYVIDGERYAITECIAGQKEYVKNMFELDAVDDKSDVDRLLESRMEDARERSERLDMAIASLNSVNPVTETMRTRLPSLPEGEYKMIDEAETLAVVVLDDGKYLARVETRELLAGPFEAMGKFDNPGTEGFCSVKTKEGEYNFLNKEGNLVLDRSYAQMSSPACGIVKVGMETENGMRFNFIDIVSGKTLSSEWFVNGIEKGECPDEWNLVESPGEDHEPRFNFINTKGQFMYNSPVDQAKAFKDHTAYIRVAQAWYRIDESGKKVARLKREPGVTAETVSSGMANQKK